MTVWEALKNVSLFCQDKTLASATQMIVTERGIVFITTDNYVAIQRAVEIQTNGHEGCYLSPKRVKALEKEFRDFSGSDAEAMELLTSETIDCPNEAWWQSFYEMIYEGSAAATENDAFEIHPKRLTLLSRLEPKDQYPLSLQNHVSVVSGAKLVHFTYGPDTVGWIKPLNKEVLREKFDDPWWLL